MSCSGDCGPIVVTLLTGAPGVQGEQGVQGVQGPQGPEGPQGPAGSVGTVTGDVSISTAGVATLSTVGVAALAGGAGKALTLQVDAKGRVLAVTAQDASITTSQVQNLSLATLGGVSTTDPRLTDSRTPTGAASGDLAGTYPAPTLATVGTAGVTGAVDKALLLQTDAKGRVLAVTAQAISITTAQVQNLSLATLGGVATTDPRLTDARTPTGTASGDLAGTYPAPTLATVGTAGVTGSADKALVIQTDAKGRVVAATAQAINITTSQVQNLSLETLGGVATTDPRLSDARTPSGAAGGDLAGTYPNPTLGTVGTAGVTGSSDKALLIQTDAKGRVVAATAQAISITTSQVQNLSLATLGGVATTDPRLSDARTPSGAAGGDLAGTFPNPTLGTVTTAGSAGSATVVPVVTIDAKGRVTSLTSAQIAALTTAQVAGLSTATPAAIATTGAVGVEMFAARADHVHALATFGTPGVFGSGSVVPVVTVDAFGRVASVTTAEVSSAGVTTTGLAPLESPALTGTPTAPTASAGTNSTQIATTAFVASNSGDRYKTTSGSTATIGNGTKTFSVASGLSYSPTQDVTVIADVDNHMHGTVVSYSGTTLVVEVAQHTGSGTFSSWTINVGGLTTAAGALLASNNLNDVSNVATARTNLGAVSTARQVIAGTGLSGGGDLTADRTLSLAASGVAAGNYGGASAVPVLTVDTYGRLTSVTTAQAAALTTNDIRGLSTVEGAALTTAGVVGLSTFAARADHSHKVATVYARTKTVGVDAATIQGCIDLITDASATNQAQVVVPPGYYVENLTLKPCVSVVASGANNGQISTVRIVGNATFTGGATAADNTLQLVGLSFNTNHATLPALTVAASGGVTTLLHVQDCMVISSNAASTAVGIQVGTNCSARLVNVRTQGNTTAGQGGTHVDVDGGTFYGENWTTEYGTRALLLRGTNGALKPYGELKWCNILVAGSNALEITSNTALLTMGWTSVGNLAATGNGINVAAGSVVGATQCVFSIQAGASNYVVTGAAGSYYYSLGNSYSNAPGATYETKIGALVTQFQYARSYDPASGDLTGSFPAPTLAAVTTAQSNVGSATAIPRLSIDAKGRVTALSTVAVSALTTAQLAGLSTATPAVLATTGAVGTSLFAARADHVHALTTLGVAGTFGGASAVPVVTVDAFGRVASVTTAGISGGGGASLTTADAAPLGALASAGVSALAARGDHIHPLPTAAQVGAIATTGTVKLSINTALTTTAALSLAPLAVAPAAPTAGDIWVRGNILEFAGTGSTVATPGSNQNNTYTGVQTFSNRVSVTATSGSALTVTQGGGGTNTGAIVTGATNSGVPLMRVTQTGAGDALVVEDSTNPDSTAFTVNAVGRVGIGLSVATTETAALTVDAGGIKFADGTLQTTAIGALTTAGLASLSSPAFTGIPTAPTASAGTNSTQIATTAFVLTNGGDKYKTTSSTTAAIANGTQTFTVAAGLSYTPTQDVTIVANVSNHMHGTVTSYSGTTLVVDVSQHTGSGTFSSWTINVGGAVSGGASPYDGTMSYVGQDEPGIESTFARGDHSHPVNGDLSSTPGGMQVVGLQGVLFNGAPIQFCIPFCNESGTQLIWSGLSGDLAQPGPGVGDIEVQKLRGNQISGAFPSDQQVLTWHNSAWTPRDAVQAADELPQNIGTAAIGASGKYARQDHSHRLVMFDGSPEYLASSPYAGTSSEPARGDHRHSINGDVQPKPGQADEVQIVRLQGVLLNTGATPTPQTVLHFNGVEWVPADYKTCVNAIVTFLNNPPYNAGLQPIP